MAEDNEARADDMTQGMTAETAETELVTRWRTSAEMDSETAMQLRTALAPLFQRAASWQELRAALAAKGLDLAIRGGRLTVIETAGGAELCTGRWLGAPLATLAARLGRPCVKALPGSDAAGEFLN
ncbi:hypothetical protein DRV85_07135 [Rhodosalinus halophilus]|jgi:hypothetical protein|uniref:Uncharacterized protein n=1 Tax=Rhodosalinus halophilus TaxID=2259333 RepID=A0A365UB35_9RHOB|nr:hypothetical protein [Rhodosalinus halophilus]RBI85507.1 hypothetical protein DRV85_07135 [Rhodosalinus halophilus]